MNQFIVAAAAAEENRWCFSVTLAEHPNGEEGPVLELQRGLSFDEQDRRLGQDTYCLSVNCGEATHYGGVVSWSLRERVLEIRLDDGAQEGLEVDEGFRLDLRALDEATLGAIEAGLHRIFDPEIPPQGETTPAPASPLRGAA